MRTTININNNNRLLYETILIIYFTIKPLYVFKSGGMQPSDMFLAVSFIWTMFKQKGRFSYCRVERAWLECLSAFTVFVVLVNCAWYASSSNGTAQNTYITSCMYYIFNFLSVIICLSVSHHVGFERTARAIMRGAFLSAIVTLIGIIVKTGTQFRNTGFFNNPNQLGFHAVILLTFLCFFNEYSTKYENATIIIVAIYAAIVSLSKASFISAFALGFLYFISNKKRSVKQIIGAIIGGTLVAVVFFVLIYSDVPFILKNPILRSLRNRILLTFVENDSSLGSGRGYDRIAEMGIHLLWGMGEGDYYRFKTMPGYEIHSTYANIVVSYGLIGAAMASAVFSIPVIDKNKTIKNLCNISGVFLYCITHNGIRNTLLWILFSVLMQRKLRDS